MGAHWKTEARRAGYDPARVVDAPLSGGKFRAKITIADMKNAVIGDGANCSGARCIKRVFDADWAYVSASSAHVVPKGSKRILRFLVNGIARRQDRTMSVVGEEVILRPPPKNATLKGKVAKNKANRAGRPASSAPRPKRKVKNRSLAAQLRSS